MKIFKIISACSFALLVAFVIPTVTEAINVNYLNSLIVDTVIDTINVNDLTAFIFGSGGALLAMPPFVRPTQIQLQPQQVQGQRNLWNMGGNTDLSLVNNMTQAAKINSVNNALGNTAIGQQQGSTRVIYDALPLNALTFQLNFFENVQTRVFPFTNLNQNRLNPGESLSITRMYFCVMTAAAPPTVTLIAPLATAAATAGLYGSNFSINIAQQEVVKKYPLMSMQSTFNKSSSFANNDIIEFDNYIIIPPQLEFTVQVNLPTYVAVANNFLVCVIEGLGSLLAPKVTL